MAKARQLPRLRSLIVTLLDDFNAPIFGWGICHNMGKYVPSVQIYTKGDSVKDFIAKRKEMLRAEIQTDGVTPTLAIIQVGDNPASNSYVKGKLKDCAELGIHGQHIHLSAETTQQTLDNTLMYLSANPDVHGIIVQLPVPAHLTVKNELIDKYKDVDGFRADSPYTACTPLGIMMFLKEKNINLAGKNVVIIGRSEIVGRPMARLCLDAHATVTVCHSKTDNLQFYTQHADVIVVAAGKEKLLTREMIGDTKPVVIDVGINRNTAGKLCGDCDYQNLLDVCSYVSPVPGGVGLLTRLALMENTVQAAK